MSGIEISQYSQRLKVCKQQMRANQIFNTEKKKVNKIFFAQT